MLRLSFFPCSKGSRTVFLALLIAATGLAPRRAAGQSRGGCGGGERWLVREYREFFSSTDSAAAASRALFHLRHVPASEIVAVTDSATCERAANAYYHTSLGPPSRQRVTVIRAGRYFLVFGSHRAGEWSIVLILDEYFDGLAGITR